MRINFLNTFVDVLTFNDTVQIIFDKINKREKLQIVYLNSFKIYEISKNKDLKYSIENAELILPDGLPLVWISRLFGTKLPERICGTDLFERLLTESEKRGAKVFFLGATEQVLNNMLKNIRERFPRLKIGGYLNGYFEDTESNKVINFINSTNSDILFIGISSPKKEIWANKYKNDISCPIIKGVGGSFDIFAGMTKRAPVWMQNFGLEWLYRLIQEPRRLFKRYLIANSYFIYIVFIKFIENLIHKFILIKKE